MKTILIIIALVFPLTQVFGETLYYVDFSSPTHTIGQEPALGGSTYPKDKPTRFGYDHGTAEVLSSYGELDDQPLLLIPEYHTSRPAVRLDYSLAGRDSFLADPGRCCEG